LAVAFILVLAAAAVALIALATSRAGLSSDAVALARLDLPLGGGHVIGVSAVTGRDNHPLPVTLRDGQIWPNGLVQAGQRVSIYATVKRASAFAWLGGATEHLSLTLTTPNAQVTQQYLTLASGASLRVRFSAPVAVVSTGQLGHLQRQVLRSPQDAITLDRTAPVGSIWVGGAPRSWETPHPALVSWFPAGAAAAAVAYPPPGSTIGPSTPITLTFSKPVNQVLGGSRPPVLPITPGAWHQVNAHSIVFDPEGYGYGLGAKVKIPLPGGVELASATTPSTGTWTVPGGSTLRLQQLLATLGYLPLTFGYAGAPTPATPQAQEAAAIHPPAGSFTWRYPNVPSALHAMWAPGADGVITRGALMEFENDHNMNPDGVAGPATWKALFAAAIAGKGTNFGYTWVNVSLSSQSLELWHNGHTVLTTPVNTGVAAKPTDPGTFPVFEHIASGTMSGTNADGSHYSDPGIPWISYFNGGDALHGFVRGSYGSPQSDGCVEMPPSTAGRVWPYTPIGTIVHVF
jgi:peptidoglycan hydrolase-like protein with peptidoglycan-binding domain